MCNIFTVPVNVSVPLVELNESVEVTCSLEVDTINDTNLNYRWLKKLGPVISEQLQIGPSNQYTFTSVQLIDSASTYECVVNYGDTVLGREEFNIRVQS